MNFQSKIKLKDIVIDNNLCIRKSFLADTTYLSRLKQNLKTGAVFPPITVDKKSSKLVEGFYRYFAYKDVFGDDYKIKVNFKTFKNDLDRLLFAGEHNAKHGLKLGPIDQVNFFNRCLSEIESNSSTEETTLKRAAAVLELPFEKLKALVENRTGITETGERIALSGSSKWMAIAKTGKKLTQEQEEHARHDTGLNLSWQIKLILNHLKLNPPLDNQSKENLKELLKVIKKYLKEKKIK